MNRRPDGPQTIWTTNRMDLRSKARSNATITKDMINYLSPKYCLIRKCQLVIDIPVTCKSGFHGVGGRYKKKEVFIQEGDVLAVITMQNPNSDIRCVDCMKQTNQEASFLLSE